jgi:hypothetical protein
MTRSSAALGTRCRISFNLSLVAPLTNSPKQVVPSATLVLTRFLMSIRRMGTAKCRPCATIIPSQSHRRCASPRRSQPRCGLRVRYGSQTNAVRAFPFPLPLSFFFLSIWLSPRLSSIICRCRIFFAFARQNIRTCRVGPVRIAYAHRVTLAWVSYLNMAILIGTLSVALFNASKDPIARNFAYVYAVISIGILVRIRSVRVFRLPLLFFVLNKSIKPSFPFLLLREAVSLMSSSYPFRRSTVGLCTSNGSP